MYFANEFARDEATDDATGDPLEAACPEFPIRKLKPHREYLHPSLGLVV